MNRHLFGKPWPRRHAVHFLLLLEEEAGPKEFVQAVSNRRMTSQGQHLLLEGVKWKSLSRVWLFATPLTIQSIEFSSPEYYSGEPFPSPGDLPNPGIKPRSPALKADSLLADHKGSPRILEWVAYPFSRESSQPRSCNRGLLHCRRFLYQLSYQGNPLELKGRGPKDHSAFVSSCLCLGVGQPVFPAGSPRKTGACPSRDQQLRGIILHYMTLTLECLNLTSQWGWKQLVSKIQTLLFHCVLCDPGEHVHALKRLS